MFQACRNHSTALEGIFGGYGGVAGAWKVSGDAEAENFEIEHDSIFSKGRNHKVTARFSAGTKWLVRRSPLLERRGGRDINKMSRSLLCWSGRGGQARKLFLVPDHPVCAASEASR